MNIHRIKMGIRLFLLIFLSTAFITSASAYEIKDTAVAIRGDFVLEPAKLDVALNPGEKVTKTISITNRTANDMVFNLSTEDFVGSHDPKQTVVLLGNQRGPYTLKDYLKTEISTFTLKPKQRITLPVEISVPLDAEPGGRYGSLLVSTGSDRTSVDEDGNVQQGAKTVSRLGALFLVRVAGQAEESGQLTGFRITGPKKLFFEKGPFNFLLEYSNTGNVHLLPYGRIEIKNTFGRSAAELGVPAFFALPDSIRNVEIKWDAPFMLGRYKATALIMNGFKNGADVEEKISVAFWVIPWKILLLVLGIVLAICCLIKFFASKFEIRRKG